MKLSEYLSEERGRGSHIASVLNVAPQQVYQWASGSRHIPIERCVEIEQATDGAVTRRDLRPDDWQKIWPELGRSNGRSGKERRKVERRSADRRFEKSSP